jgi:hypothetical protein
MDIKTKYNIGEKVWTMKDNRPVEGKISNILIQIETGDWSHTILTNISYYIGDCGYIEEKYVFLTKQDLINSL